MNKVIVTKEGYALMKEKLEKKIFALKSLREEKAHAYTASGDGWHDNPGWTQLGQQEELMAKEVAQIQQRIANAIIIDNSRVDKTRVGTGCIVEYEIIEKNGSTKCHIVQIVGSGESDIKNKKIAYDTPIGKALFSMRVGDVKAVELPLGNVIIKVKQIEYVE